MLFEGKLVAAVNEQLQHVRRHNNCLSQVVPHIVSPATALCRKRTKLLSKGKPAAVVNKQLPLMSLQPPTVLGSVSEAFGDALEHYLFTNPDGLIIDLAEGKERSKSKAKRNKKRIGVDAGTWCMSRYAVTMHRPAVKTWRHVCRFNG